MVCKNDHPVAYLKLHRHHRKYAQERHAYRDWLSANDPVPHLIAADDSEQALLLSALPGQPVSVADLTPPELADRYQQAGRFLRRLHGTPIEDADPVTPANAFTLSSSQWLKRSEELIDPATLERITGKLADAEPAIDRLSRCRCHRDYTPRNWLTSSGRLSVIDFEHARHDLLLTDIERVRSTTHLVGDLSDTHDLLAAFETGYDRLLSDDEETALTAISLQSAIARIAWGRRHKVRAFEERARTDLTALLD